MSLPVGVVVVVGLLVVGWFFLGSPVSEGTIVPPACEGVSRESYGVHPSVFELLPPLPACMGSIAHAFNQGSGSGADLVLPEVFLQPEFYPSFVSEGLPVWRNPSTSHYGAVGLSGYPFSRTISLYPGDSTSVRFFLHAGFGARAFQEGRLVVDASSDGLQVSLDEYSSRSIVLEPTFPQFYPGWVRPVDVRVTVPEGTPPGSYSFSISTAPVSSEDQSFFPNEGEYYYSFVEFVGSRSIFVGHVSVLE